MRVLIPATLVFLSIALLPHHSQAQSDPDVDPLVPTPLNQLTFDQELLCFVVPATRKPFTGPIIVNYPNGKPETIGQLKDGLEEGIFREFHEDGQLSSEGAYRAGREHGPWKYWWESGEPESTGTYEDGKMTGFWTDYFPDGKPATEGNYVDGLADGPWTIYDEFTGAKTVIHYRAGKEVVPSTSSAAPTPPTDEP